MAEFGERYELIRCIGSGGMGEVWLAHDEQLASRPVAIKIMHARMLPNAADVARFEREMHLAALMDHPNIVTLHTTGIHHGAPYMVMEYLKGQDLERSFPHPVEDAERVAAIGRDICGALAYAHGRGVIHRDIKPGNLFLCDTGLVKVTDFGIARAVGGTTLSSAGVLAGTFAYMAPEQWRGDAPAFSNDVWAAGCVLYRVLSGRPPRSYSGAADYAAAAMRGDPVPDLRDITGAPPWLTGAVMSMLDPDPASRPTAADGVRLLSGVPSQVAVAGGPLPAPREPVPTRFDRTRLDPAQAGQGPAAGGADREPAVAGLPPTLRYASTSRRRPPGPLVLALGGAVIALLAALVIALQLRGSAQGAGSAAGSTTSPPASGSPAATTPAASAAPRSSPATASGSSPATASRPAATAPATTPAGTPRASDATSAPASTGPAMVPVPDVVGLGFTKARLILLSDGFKVAGRHARLGQTVTSTSPSGQAPAGSVIVVTYGAGL